MKKCNGIYEYLKAKGLLGSSDTKAIAQARKEYMREYKKKYKKERLKNGKEYKLYFSNKIVSKIQRKAKEKNIPETTVIRDALMQALTTQTQNTELLNRILHVLKIIYHNEQQTNKIEILYKRITDELLNIRTF